MNDKEQSLFIADHISRRPTKEERYEFYNMVYDAMLEKEKKLIYEEKRILQLYRYILKKEYDVNDRSIYENNKELKNHVEMQQAIYLAYKLLWTDGYGFVWDTYGPKSVSLESDLKELDKKHDEILDYYQDFDGNIYSQDSKKKLFVFYDHSKIKTLEKFTKLTNDILKEDKGIELLADLAFIGNTKIPGTKFDVANRELQKYRPIFNNNDLNKYAFRCLETFDLINSVDLSNGKIKRLK